MKALLITFLFLPVLLHAEELKKEYKKDYRKTYQVNPDAELKLDCSFATVEVQSHSGNSVEIHVEVSIEASTQEKAEKDFDRIQIELSGTSNRVEIKTDLGKQNWKNESFEIRITIKAPASMSIKSSNSFGSLDIGDREGAALIDHEYGEFKAGDLLSKENDIHVSFGSASIESMGGGAVKTEFGSMKIETVNGNLIASNSYGDLEIEQVTAQCRDLTLDTSFADTEVFLDEDVSFDLDASSSMGEIDLPKNAVLTSVKNDWNSNTYEGKIGSGSGKMKLKSSFGDIKVRMR